jgi:hypothetical protein
MKAGRSTMQQARALIGALALTGLFPSVAPAQSAAAQASSHHGSGHAPDNLVAVVREATARFQNVAAAKAAGYSLLFGCVTGPDAGAMGLHYVNLSLVADGLLDPTQPEIVIYEPLPNGRLRITGADFLVFADAWDSVHPGEPPQLMGQLLHLFDSPNRFGLPAFYTLHVWAWKDNPNGTFVNWHPDVKCDAFSDKKQ